MPKNTDEKTDESLMALVSGGDHQAFSVLVRRHADRFYGLAYRMILDRAEAEDVVQEAFLKIWNKPDIWNSARGVRFTTWFYRIVTNGAIDVARKRIKLAPTDIMDQWADERAGQDAEMEKREAQAHLESAIQLLPVQQKAALNLCFYEGLSNKEAADILGVGLKALESLLMRAKTGLRDRLMREQKIERRERHG
ncbi:MAG: sigma-70 family RNA polymerase sigma factor [Rhodospirillales bacterium]|nr:sigma-70 family RNA polymerase sigma factor [Alphaproteobacteria bacterium]USO03774.1 MAG: sigma-70 family RNA polymerase sigma factor [Rhodospirillales bacterium]